MESGCSYINQVKVVSGVSLSAFTTPSDVERPNSWPVRHEAFPLADHQRSRVLFIAAPQRNYDDCHRRRPHQRNKWTPITRPTYFKTKRAQQSLKQRGERFDLASTTSTKYLDTAYIQRSFSGWNYWSESIRTMSSVGSIRLAGSLPRFRPHGTHAMPIPLVQNPGSTPTIPRSQPLPILPPCSRYRVTNVQDGLHQWRSRDKPQSEPVRLLSPAAQVPVRRTLSLKPVDATTDEGGCHAVLHHV